MVFPRSGRSFIAHLHAFRGIAIILIVGTHAFVTANFWLGTGGKMKPDKLLMSVIELVFHNSTIFFALISGLLFSTVLHGRGWTRFFRSKLLYAIVPYVLFSVPFTYFHWTFRNGYEEFQGTPAEFLSKLTENLLSGSASFQFWYIPVLAGLFVLTPTIWWFVGSRASPFFLAASLAVPLFVSRILPQNGWENLLFFLGPYTLGIWLGADYETRMERLARRSLLLVVLLILASIAAAYLHYFSDAHGIPRRPINLFESASYVQKMALALIVLLWLKEREGWLPHWLDQFAIYAFAIFFVHQIILFWGQDLLNRFVADRPNIAAVLAVGAAWWIVALCGSLAIAKAMHKMLGMRSRMIIGS